MYPEMNAHQKKHGRILKYYLWSKAVFKRYTYVFNGLNYLNLYLQNVKSYSYKHTSWGSCIQIKTETERKYHYACFI